MRDAYGDFLDMILTLRKTDMKPLPPWRKLPAFGSRTDGATWVRMLAVMMKNSTQNASAYIHVAF